MPYLEPLRSPFFHLFSKWRNQFKNYRAGGMIFAAWLRLPINNYSVSVIIFDEANASFISVVQAVCFSSGRNTLREWVFMPHPRHVLCSASCPSHASFLKESGSSRFRGSYGCSGRKSVWMTNRAALFLQSIQCSSSTVMVMMSLTNPSIDDSVDVMSSDKGPNIAICLADWCLSSCRNKDWCGKFRSSVSQDSFQSRSFTRSIDASLKFVYLLVQVWCQIGT